MRARQGESQVWKGMAGETVVFIQRKTWLGGWMKIQRSICNISVSDNNGKGRVYYQRMNNTTGGWVPAIHCSLFPPLSDGQATIRLLLMLRELA